MISVVVLTHNRLTSLQRCVNSIRNTSTQPLEIIVVDNASTDGTAKYLDSQRSENFRVISLDKNYGVIARNHGFAAARGEFLAQVDDDVYVHPGWDSRCLEIFSRFPKVGMVGQQGGIIKKWMDIHSHVHVSRNGFVDHLTGFFMMMRNIGLRYDEAFGFRWFEELDLSFQYRAAGYQIYILNNLCTHCSLAGPVDWDLHNRNLEYCNQKWRDRVEILDLEGMKA